MKKINLTDFHEKHYTINDHTVMVVSRHHGVYHRYAESILFVNNILENDRLIVYWANNYGIGPSGIQYIDFCELQEKNGKIILYATTVYNIISIYELSDSEKEISLNIINKYRNK